MKSPSIHYPVAGEIVIFQPEFVEFGGEERVILALCRELQAQDKPHCVLCYWDHIGLAKHATWPLTVRQLQPARNPFAKVLALRRCLRHIRQLGSPTPALFNIQSAYHAGLAADAPYHVRIPDTYSLLGFSPDGAAPLRPGAQRRLRSSAIGVVNHFATRRGIQRAERFVTNTAALRTEMQGLYGRRAEVIYLGGFGMPRSDWPPRAERPIGLLTVSRLQASKRIDWILHALAAVVRDAGRYPPCHLHIAGSGPERDALVALADALGLADSVTFHGFVSDETLAELYQRCQVFLMPGRQGYGLPAIEALYQKQAVVVSDESGVVELLAGTPWAAVASQGKDGFTRALQDLLLRVSRPDFMAQPLPVLPTETSWAKNMIAHFSW